MQVILGSLPSHRTTRSMGSHNDEIRDKVFNLLAFNHDWVTMSNDTADGANSLEGIHDNIHFYIGGLGHMGDVPMAAFDPIFFLHHTNVSSCPTGRNWAALTSCV